ncbi:MAG: hypothetical protein V1645_02195 [archaeon]
MRGKKGTTETYSFLIGLIITFLLLTTVGCIAYNYLSKGSETDESFKNLVDVIKNLKDGEEGKIPLYLDEDHLIVGFRADSPTVESKAVVYADFVMTYCYGWYTHGYDGLQIERPEKCQGKGCICLCEYKKDFSKEKTGYETWVRNGVFINKNVCSGTEDRCVTDEKIEQYNIIGQKGCDVAFIPGWKYKVTLGRAIVGQIAVWKRETAPVYYQRKGSTIVIDDEQPSKEDIQKEAQNLTINTTKTI